MHREDDIAGLRSRVSALVEQESGLLNQAFELSRAGGDRRGVDALFAQVQAIQVERSILKKQIGDVLGSHRLHMASEVWRPGVYSYRPAVGGESLQVSVTSAALGLQVTLPGRPEPVRIETLEGTFDGPLAVDDAVAPRREAQGQSAGPAARQSRKKPL